MPIVFRAASAVLVLAALLPGLLTALLLAALIRILGLLARLLAALLVPALVRMALLVLRVLVAMFAHDVSTGLAPASPINARATLRVPQKRGGPIKTKTEQLGPCPSPGRVPAATLSYGGLDLFRIAAKNAAGALGDRARCRAKRGSSVAWKSSSSN